MAVKSLVWHYFGTAFEFGIKIMSAGLFNWHLADTFKFGISLVNDILTIDYYPMKENDVLCFSNGQVKKVYL